jgi:tetratricopeptide (TPR) repeat protein
MVPLLAIMRSGGIVVRLPGWRAAARQVVLAFLGDYDAALAYCQKALAIHESRCDHHGHAATLDSLGYAHHRMGGYEEAATRYRQAAELFGTLGDQRYQATVLNRLADTSDAAGRPTDATLARRQALEILERLNARDTDGLPAIAWRTASTTA